MKFQRAMQGVVGWGLLVLTAAACACAASAAEKVVEASIATTAAGVRFDDPEIVNAVVRFESGDQNGAIKHLEYCVGDPGSGGKSPRQYEQWTALGMLRARASDRPAAVKILRRIAANKDDPDLALRAKVLLDAVSGAFRSGAHGGVNLTLRADWLSAVRGVRDGLAREIREVDARLLQAVQDTRWESLGPLLEQVAAHAGQAQVIEIDRERTEQAVRQHAAIMADASTMIAQVIRERQDAVRKLEQENVRVPDQSVNRERKAALRAQIAQEEQVIRRMREARRLVDAARAGGSRHG